MSKMAELDMGRQTLEQITSAMPQRCAVAQLIGCCESIVASGRLTEPAEQSLRLLIASALSAFNMQHHQFERDQRAVHAIMGAANDFS
jgi:hypothetical protein